MGGGRRNSRASRPSVYFFGHFLRHMNQSRHFTSGSGLVMRSLAVPHDPGGCLSSPTHSVITSPGKERLGALPHAAANDNGGALLMQPPRQDAQECGAKGCWRSVFVILCDHEHYLL